MSSITSAQGSLTMIGLNTSSPKVFFNGQEVPDILAINVVNNETVRTVSLKLAETPLIADLVAAGIQIRR